MSYFSIFLFICIILWNSRENFWRPPPLGYWSSPTYGLSSGLFFSNFWFFRDKRHRGPGWSVNLTFGIWGWTWACWDLLVPAFLLSLRKNPPNPFFAGCWGGVWEGLSELMLLRSGWGSGDPADPWPESEPVASFELLPVLPFLLVDVFWKR